MGGLLGGDGMTVEQPCSGLAEILAVAAQVEKLHRLGMAYRTARRMWTAFEAVSPKRRASLRTERITGALGDWHKSGGGELPSACLADRDTKALTVGWFLRQGMMPPRDLAAFGADVLTDSVGGGGRSREIDRFRAVIVYVVCCLGGLKPKRAASKDAALRKGPHRAEASRGTIAGDSACDIAARAMRITYDHCLDLWKKRGKNDVQISKEEIEEVSKGFWTQYRAERLGGQK